MSSRRWASTPCAPGAPTAGSKPLLDTAAAHGIKVVNGFWLNQGADYVNDTAYMDSTLDQIKQWVTTYKNHPGVLMWDVGNEVILTTQDHTYNGTTVEQQRVAYAKYVERVTQAIHAIDTNHPVTSTDAYTAAWKYYKDHTPSLDLLAVNSYGSVCNVKADWIAAWLHQAVHHHRVRRGRRVGGPERRQRRAHRALGHQEA